MKGILLVPDQSAFLMIAGLPVLTRALCAGRKGGIVNWLVLTAEYANECEQLIAEEPRLRGLHSTVVQKDQFSQQTFPEWLGEDDAIVLSCTAIFDYRLIQHVTESRGPLPRSFIARDGQGIVCMVGDAAALWPFLPLGEQCFTASHLPAVALNKGLWIPYPAARQYQRHAQSHYAGVPCPWPAERMALDAAVLLAACERRAVAACVHDYRRVRYV